MRRRPFFVNNGVGLLLVEEIQMKCIKQSRVPLCVACQDVTFYVTNLL